MQALNYHSLCVTANRPAWHSEGVEDQDKNGGPNYLREWRVFRRLTQQERGERGLSAKWLRRLAPALDTTPGMILDHNPEELDNDVVEIWATASHRDRRRMADVMRALVKTGTDDA